MKHDKSCWLQSPHDLLLHAILSYGMDRGLVIQSKQTKLTDVFYLLKKIIFGWLCTTHNPHYVSTDMYVTLKVHVFSNQGDQAPGDPVYQSALLQFPQSSVLRTTSRLLAEMVQPPRLF